MIRHALETFSSSAERRGSKSWIATITSKHPKFKFNREFINTLKIDKIRKISIDNMCINQILEIGYNYYTGSGNKETGRKYYQVKNITENDVFISKLETENNVLSLLE